MPGDKWPEHTPDIGKGGRLLMLAIVALVVVAAFGWMVG